MHERFPFGRVNVATAREAHATCQSGGVPAGVSTQVFIEPATGPTPLRPGGLF